MAGALRSPDGTVVMSVPAILRGLSLGGGQGALSGSSLDFSGGRSVISLAGSLCLDVSGCD